MYIRNDGAHMMNEILLSAVLDRRKKIHTPSYASATVQH